MTALGIDTSNYTTSVALYSGKDVKQVKKTLKVKQGDKGLRQSSVVFEHLKNISGMLHELFKQDEVAPDCVGVSVKPTDDENSYMPCFLVGKAIAESIVAPQNIDIDYYSHRQNHIASALWSSGKIKWMQNEEFIAIHISGGTTDCLHIKTKENMFERIEKIGGSLDLKAGQLVDRVGVMMGLSFPCGSSLEKLADDYEHKGSGDRFKVNVKGMNCCLSGIENMAKKDFEENKSKQRTAHLTMRAIIDTIDLMLANIKQKHKGARILFMGGVASNKTLRDYFIKRHRAVFGSAEYCLDNAAGVAILSYLKMKEKRE